ncbi:DUF6493 family protein [Roseovarius aestuarii]|uniref:Uncharacterized protein n=1 Tax=Roseovarius aestuarii TaxID=475083 RepID=A0A1X7BUU0_9RHOB|nr:DUF6493 family protein [Roseovarius aestuarii]SMC13344.1 hypothetical protein ROA7745_03190 [Roseovarius aestuarii]
MTEQEFQKLITTNSAGAVMKQLAKMPEKERRAYAKTAHRCFKAYGKALWDSQLARKPIPVELAIDGEALKIAVLATGMPSKLAREGWRVLPSDIPLGEIFKALKPSWIGRWAEMTVEANPRLFDTVRELHQQGLCQIPKSDGYILGYYAHQRFTSDLVDENFLRTDVWRFFEVEGGGEFSLASHDKYASGENTWSTVLLKLCADGLLDRDRLLDASLDALERDFGQFRASWYSRFHAALAPTPEEYAARTDRYLHLLGSAVPPTMSFALKALRHIDKLGDLSPKALLAAIEPALQARQKSSVKAALQLLKNCAKKHPDHAVEIAKTATAALISEAGETQEQALDLIEHLNQSQNPAICALLAEYVDTAAPGTQKRLSSMLGVQATPQDASLDYPIPELQAINTVASAEEAVSVFLELLEDGRDPFLMERAMAGLARYGAAAHSLLSPVGKRAKQIRKRIANDGYRTAPYFLRPISATALAWVNGTDVKTELRPFLEPRYPGHQPIQISDHSFEGLFLARSEELLGFARAGHSVPMLSMPTDNRGYLDAARLIDRLKTYRALSLQPGVADFKLALMRLAPEGREKALAIWQPQTEAERALAYALGADFAPEDDKQLWVVAWSSRLPLNSDPQIHTLVGKEIAGAGTPITFEFDAIVHRSDEYFWPAPVVTTSPEPSKDLEGAIAFGIPWKSEQTYISGPHPSWMSKPCEWWVSVLRPAHSELVFATGILELYLDQILADHHCLTFLEPFFRPGLQPGVMAHALLAWYLAAADGAVGARTQDAIATLVAQQNFSPAQFADAAQKLIFKAGLPLRGWTKRVREITTFSPDHASAIRDALSAILTATPTEPPRDLGGILELLYELHVASGTAVTCPDLLSALSGVRAGGKIGKFSKKLAALKGQ